uniref:MYND-type domain-containing protein n=1 Tax=Aureoumbra lagunensis TaxID=44058 RepID=A0A7S3JR94_9STRA|mmetsp:Transcript_6921/g.10301  ORF Transcript_6921/g.10301 Transcript_6921/m.10301 type:complete len:477 (+) Transcript_6921:51-1481(+)|eukprot:CAMPEP_0197308702 /NCGR_PEP_ID=MMETSP0891-20130614/7133_1 /TAXON_ID=44058 ORGANISM="Aureoumbra lagunensis, Strain CCMP1510" /NCGR_SAMPLE_ID=MMETSP0891 /ASSEMBLY_ACC=CAM_ASM_000534 /LENGTH=476 /DNA_ID=CAMNT_0042793275 /DNA_START=43 /DNA_END=1473 /DNA_ORIENTATION=+
MNDAFLLHPRSVYGGEEGNGDEKSDMIRKTGCPPTRKNEIENSLQALLNTTVLGRGGINDEEGSLQNLLAKSPTKKTSNIQLPKRASKSRLWHDFNGNDAATDKDSDVFASLYDDLKEGSSAKMSRATTKSKHNITPSTNQSKNEKEEKAALPKARKIKTDQAVRLQKKSQQCNNWICEKQGTFRCGKCASRWYCSRTCQKNDWINVHRAQCVKKSTTQESQIIRDRSQSVALARQDEALRELKGVDYVIFEDVNPRTGRTCEEIHIRLPNMGAKILSRLCRLKAAESHLFFLKKLYKLFIDYAPQYTIRIRSQLQAEYNVDPHSPAVQRSNDQNSFIHPTPYETNRIFAQLGIASIEDQVRKCGVEQSMAEAKAKYGSKSLDETLAEKQGISLEEFNRKFDAYEASKKMNQEEWAKKWINYRENGGPLPCDDEAFLIQQGNDRIFSASRVSAGATEELCTNICLESDEDGVLVAF